jgi:hypothetical protein
LEYFQVIYRILQIDVIICRYFKYFLIVWKKNSGTAVKLATKNENIFKLFILIIYSSVSDPYLESGSRRAKMTLKNRKNVKKFHVFWLKASPVA